MLKLILKWLFAAIFVAAGFLHFYKPQIFLRIMPPFLPGHLFLVYLSGFFEIFFGILLLVPRFSAFAAWGLIALLIAVFPANIYMAANPSLFPEINPVLLSWRLPLQLVLIAWAYWFTIK